MQEALLAHDGVHPRTALTDAVLDEFKHDPRGIVEFARLSKPGDFGRYAPLVFDHARRGDPQAIAIVEAGALTVNESLDAIMALAGAPQLCLLGGLAPLYPQWLSERHRTILVEAKADALSGAVALAAISHRQRTGAAA